MSSSSAATAFAAPPSAQHFFPLRPSPDGRHLFSTQQQQQPPPLASPTTSSAIAPQDDPSPRMRSHNGNRPSLPQSKHCPLCPAKFTRTTHLNRHLRTHTNERLHRCDTCMAEFTRSDLLTRHKRSCGDLANQNKSRRKSCQACAESKVKCDLKQPCTKCISRGKECVFVNDPNASREKKAAALARRKAKIAAQQQQHQQQQQQGGLNGSGVPELDPSTSSTSSSSRSSPSPTSLSASSIDLTPVGGFGFDSASSLSLQTPSDEHAHASLFDFPGSDLLFTSPLADMSAPHCADLGAEYAAAFRVGSDLEALDQSLAKLMADDALAGMAAGHDGIFVSGADHHHHHQHHQHAHQLGAGLSMHDLAFPPFDAAAQWLADDLPGHGVGASIADVASSYMGLYQQQQPGFDASIASMYPPSGGQFLSQSMHGTDTLSGMSPDVPTYAELQHYLYLFLTSFLSHMPIVHVPTWSLEGKPDVLVHAMYACGALFVKTPLAQQFVASTLESARETLRQAAENPPSSLDEQLYLVLAGVLLQAVWFIHHRFEERATASAYHNLIVMMIHRSGFISRCASWTPPRLDGADAVVVESAWRDWACQESLKRLLCVAYLQDTWLAIFFGVPPSSLQASVEWALPADDALWRASSAREWLDVLRVPQSPYGAPAARLTGCAVKHALVALGAMHVAPLMLPLSAFAHSFLIHAILMSIYAAAFEATAADAAKPDSFVLQHGLHNWFNSWTHAPDADTHLDKGLPSTTSSTTMTSTTSNGDTPRLVQNARPFYLLAQVSLLAGSQSTELFQLPADARYRVVRHWMPHIRAAMRSGEQGPPAFWIELMRIAVKDVTGTNLNSDLGGSGDGLALFFPEL